MLYLRYLTAVLGFSAAAIAQTFSSGSTGADGAFNCTQTTATVQLPASGVLNYTTVNVGSNCTLSFLPNLNNTSVVMLAQGAVTIAGLIQIGANGTTPGPGGFYGGGPGQPGLGPGGGQPTSGQYVGTWAGPLSLFPIIGGSGGAGTPDCYPSYSASIGGGGGGGIVIASSTSVTFTGVISADGGFGSNYCLGDSGSGGAIRIVANSITLAINSNTGIYPQMAAAVARLEAPLGQVIGISGGTAPVIAPINPEIVPTNPP